MTSPRVGVDPVHRADGPRLARPRAYGWRSRRRPPGAGRCARASDPSWRRTAPTGHCRGVVEREGVRPDRSRSRSRPRRPGRPGRAARRHPSRREPDGPTHTTIGTAERRIARTSDCTSTSTAPPDASWITSTSARRSFAPRIESRISVRVRRVDEAVDLRDLDPVPRALLGRAGDVGRGRRAAAARRARARRARGCGEVGGTGVGAQWGSRSMRPMELEQFCSTSRVLIVAGKGGVGKTTVTASLATTAARAGLSVLIVEVEGKSGLSAAFGVPDLGYEEIDLAPGIRARTLTPDHALVDYLETHGLKRISKRLTSTGTLDVVATAVPGMKDILVLGKVKSLERDGVADLILVDAPAAGHAVSFLLSPRGLLDAVSVGPIRKQATDVIELLSDPARCQVLLVTIPEETPVNELVDTAFTLEDRVGVALGPIVVNGCYPEMELRTDAEGISRRRRGRRRLPVRARSRRPRPLGGVPRRAAGAPAHPGRPARAAAPAPADPVAVPVQRRRRAHRDRLAGRRAPHRDRAARWVTSGGSSTRGTSSSAAAVVASARRPRPRCSRSRARGAAATPWS